MTKNHVRMMRAHQRVAGALRRRRKADDQSTSSLMLFALALLSLVAIGQNAFYWTELPEQVATHFNAAGEPDSWMDKTSATVMLIALQLGLPWMLVGIGRMTRMLPASLINIPNREYWLSDDRREASLAFVQQFVLAVAVTASLFIMVINHLTFVANIRGESLNLPAFVLLLVLYLAGIALMIFGLRKRFRVARSATQS